MKTLEAALAIILTFAVVTYFIGQNQPVETRETTLSILPVLEQNPDFRTCVITNNTLCVESQIRNFLPGKYSFNVSISADPNYIISGLPAKNVHADSVFIAGNETIYQPMIVRLYYWIG